MYLLYDNVYVLILRMRQTLVTAVVNFDPCLQPPKHFLADG